MNRWRIVVEYNGADYVGWQRQKNGHSIQEALEDAIFGFSGENARVYGAGRTDSGVHALGQVAHFDLQRPTDENTIRDALNAHLRDEAISVLDATHVPKTFNARTSARERVYNYRIVNRRAPPALYAGRAWHVGVPLDNQAMHEAAQRLVGHHDFTSFRATTCQALSPIKTLDILDVRREACEILITARARSFLQHQVRNMVGTLERVGAGKWSVNDVSKALDAKDRSAAGPTAPAYGLYLLSVLYPNSEV